jgi:quercetin dioxygenase-like cupin family protein
MNHPHQNLLTPIEVRPLGSAVREATTAALVKADGLDVIRLIVPAGKSIPTHRAKGTMTLLCIEGRISFEACGRTMELAAGQMLWLPAEEPHSVLGLEDASLLLTIWKTPAPSESRKDIS